MRPEAGHIETMRHEDNVVQAAIQRLEKYLEASRDSFDKRVLKDRQVGVMEDLYTFLATHTEELHGYISLPTGVGKTVLFTELIKATGLKRLLHYK